jgi:hypothetical protein
MPTSIKIFALWLITGLVPQVSQAAGLDDLAEHLLSQADSLAERNYDRLSYRGRASRADVEAAYQAQQLSASANLFRRMVRDRRSNTELRDAVSILQGQLRGLDRYAFDSRQWSDLERTFDDLAREVNLGTPGRVDGPPRREVNPGWISGRMRWRGRVDDEVHVSVRRSGAETRAVGGLPVSNVNVNFTSPLPSRRVEVSVNKIKGRGSIQVIQQPSRNNDFMAVIQIRDEKGGSSDYEFELVW